MIDNIDPYLNDKIYFDVSESDKRILKGLERLSSSLFRNKYKIFIAGPVYAIPLPLVGTILSIPFYILGDKLDKDSHINLAIDSSITNILSKDTIKGIRIRIKKNDKHRDFFSTYTDYIISLYKLEKIKNEGDLLKHHKVLNDYLIKYILSDDEIDYIKKKSTKANIKNMMK